MYSTMQSHRTWPQITSPDMKWFEEMLVAIADVGNATRILFDGGTFDHMFGKSVMDQIVNQDHAPRFIVSIIQLAYICGVWMGNIRFQNRLDSHANLKKPEDRTLIANSTKLINHNHGSYPPPPTRIATRFKLTQFLVPRNF